jgi:hypothetical protein
MISQKEMLDIICTEAIEGPEGIRGTNRQGYLPPSRGEIPENPNRKDTSKSFYYDLRLVRYYDGRLEWVD